MKRLIPLLFVLITINSTVCRAQTDSLQKQINEQVWKPFIKTFNERDPEGFMAVHSKEMIRVIQDGDKIFGYDKYYEDNVRSKERNKQSKWKTTLELRFIQRIAGNDKAFEVGYFKSTSTSSDGETRKGYGKFHVLLRKENGIWKILMDADAQEKTDEAIFMTGKPIE